MTVRPSARSESRARCRRRRYDLQRGREARGDDEQQQSREGGDDITHGDEVTHSNLRSPCAELSWTTHQMPSDVPAGPSRSPARTRHARRWRGRTTRIFPWRRGCCRAPMRPHVAAVYAFARVADDIADEGAAPPADRLTQLDAWQRRLHAAVAVERVGRRAARARRSDLRRARLTRFDRSICRSRCSTIC